MTDFSAEELHHQLNQGALESVASALEQIFQQEQIEVAFWQLKSKLQWLTKNTLEAIETLEEALSHFPSEAFLHHELAHLYLEQKNYLLAGEHFHAARAFAPESLRYTLELTEYFLFLGQRRDALIYLQEAMQMSSKPEEHYPLLGQIWALFGRYQDAEAAWLQSLESNQSIITVQLSLLRLYLSQRNFGKALTCSLNLKACSPLFANEPKLWSEACHLWALEAYWQGDLSTARELWRESLSHGISAEAFYALTVAIPLVYQDPQEETNWKLLLKEGLEVLKKSKLPPPTLQNLPEFLPPTFFKAENLALKKAINQWLYQFFQPQKFEAHRKDTPLRLGFIAPDLNNLEVQAYLQALKEASISEPIELSLYYLQPETLPQALDNWTSEAFQLPAHSLALKDYFTQEPVDALAFLGFTSELYVLALQRAAAHQILMPTQPQSSGLDSMDYVLCHKQSPPDLSLYTESPLPSPEPVYLLQAQAKLTQSSRSDWNLPRLGHLYLIPAEPQFWTVQTDELLWQILQEDRKAFIIGLQTPGSTLHTRVMQRHENSLKGRQHRIRWLNLSPKQFPELLNLIDLVIEPPEINLFWACAQALLQEKVVITYAANTSSICQTSALLHELNLTDLLVQNNEELALLACRLLKNKGEHAILKERLKTAREHLLTIQSKRAAKLLQSIYQKINQTEST